MFVLQQEKFSSSALERLSILSERKGGLYCLNIIFKDHVRLCGCNLVWRLCDTFEAKFDSDTYSVYNIYIYYKYVCMKYTYLRSSIF